MIIFDQLRISDDGNRLYINLHVNGADYFTDRYLESITVIPTDKVSETAPDLPTSDYIYKQEFSGEQKTADLVIDQGVLDLAFLNWDTTQEQAIDNTKPYANMSFSTNNMSKTLFFVYVKCKENTSDPCIPCPLAELTTLGVTFDENLLYQRVLGFTKALADTCQIPVGFADFILLWNAFRAAIETEHYIPAIKYYKMLFGGYGGFGIVSGNYKPCGCHG